MPLEGRRLCKAISKGKHSLYTRIGKLWKQNWRENVENLYNKYKDGLDKICSKLSDYGYNSNVFKLDGEDCGIPQSRKRVFVVCIRKDIDTGLFEAPQSLPFEIQLEDIFEDYVGCEGFYIKDKGLGRFFREAVAVGALPDTNTVDDPIAVVRDKK